MHNEVGLSLRNIWLLIHGALKTPQGYIHSEENLYLTLTSTFKAVNADTDFTTIDGQIDTERQSSSSSEKAMIDMM